VPAAARSGSYAASANAEDPNRLPERTFYLNNVTQPNEANEIVSALRNFLPPEVKSYLVSSQNAILISATTEQLAAAQKIIDDLDRPRKSYRLTYTVSEMDGEKRVSSEHYAMVMVSGQPTTLKQGSKVPVATGSYNAVASGTTPAGAQTQFTYLDVGMNFTASLESFSDGALLRSEVERSSVAEEKSGVGPQDPIMRQSVLRGAFHLISGKSQMLGSLDIPGSTHRLEIEVALEELPKGKA
jgi:type II secretory pathway component GspD/PulD (secretin)